MRRGTLLAATAYVLWGVLPIYWKALQDVPALEILVHRVLWSLVVTLALLALRRQWHWLRDARKHPGNLRVFVFTALLLSVNWFTYIWANNNNHIVEASLGYFITPLVSVLLGLLILRERLRPTQFLAVIIAASGVLYLVVNAGGLLWISLALAFSFGFYGLLRKTAKLGSLEGLTTEMSVLFLPSLAYMLLLEARGDGAFGHAGLATTVLLACAGIVTAVPLLLFASGARQVPLTTLGVLQYIAPTLQFVLGVFVYGEPFDETRLVGFAIIWIALAIYTVEGYLARRRRREILLPG